MERKKWLFQIFLRIFSSILPPPPFPMSKCGGELFIERTAHLFVHTCSVHNALQCPRSQKCTVKGSPVVLKCNGSICCDILCEKCHAMCAVCNTGNNAHCAQWRQWQWWLLKGTDKWMAAITIALAAKHLAMQLTQAYDIKHFTMQRIRTVCF